MDVLAGSPFAQKTVLIDISESTTISEIIDTEHYSEYALKMPAAWTGTGNMTFQGAADADDTFVAILDEGGTALALTAPGADDMLSFDATLMRYLNPFRFIKLVAGDAQAADRSLTMYFSARG